ncbi:transposase (plasmid) [Limimaricola variabilis]|uniref:transposase n=1 Tax=Limimaricola variabilis TaxID=1492771 RepID=UPI002AC9D148|nr:transposase [Limimaricola variabilis]WPY97021.1 transposase [Limimaricola variabilis]
MRDRVPLELLAELVAAHHSLLASNLAKKASTRHGAIHNAIESLNRVIRKSIKTRGSFPTDEAATKLIYLAIRNFEKDGRNVREWFAARNQFAIMFGERFDA